MVAVSVLALILTMLAIGMIVTLIVFIYQLSQGRIL